MCRVDHAERVSKTNQTGRVKREETDGGSEEREVIVTSQRQKQVKVLRDQELEKQTALVLL